MKKEKQILDRGKFKMEIHSALYKSKNIVELLLGDVSNMTSSQIQEQFKDHVKSHLFIDDTITDKTSFIFYDVVIPKFGATIKDLKIVMYAICHRDILDDYEKEGFYGNRADILAEMIEDVLINDKEVSNSFGIGELTLEGLEIYNAVRFYGCALTFGVPNFR